VVIGVKSSAWTNHNLPTKTITDRPGMTDAGLFFLVFIAVYNCFLLHKMCNAVAIGVVAGSGNWEGELRFPQTFAPFPNLHTLASLMTVGCDSESTYESQFVVALRIRTVYGTVDDDCRGTSSYAV